MGVYEGRGQLSRAMKDLLRHWAEVRSTWTDVNAKRFEENVLAPLEVEVRNATAAMDHMAQVLNACRRDCE